jgi:hypothetical protein
MAIAENSVDMANDRIIICDGPGSSLEVAFLLLKCLLSSKSTQGVKNYMIYK